MSVEKDRNKWFILFLMALTDMIVVAMPSMAMSVLSKEISDELGLTLVQVGVIWGIGSLPTIVTCLVAGVIGDKLGPKRVLIAASLLVGLLGAARGLAQNYLAMVLIVIFLGALIPFVTLNGIKLVGQLFPTEKLGMANGVLSMGMALGFLVGSLMSATVFSPLLGGWRNVLLVYGLLGSVFCVPWFFARLPSVETKITKQSFSAMDSIRQVAKLKNIWLLGLVLFGMAGCVQGVLGYLPLYLRGLGWEAIRADGALTLFHTISMIFVVPIALLSDRLRTRKKMLLITISLIAVGTGALGFINGNWIWGAILITGFVRDGCMSLIFAMVIETEGVGPLYAGTATGFITAISSIGMMIAPPLGNSLATYRMSSPFLLWSASAIMGLILLGMIKTRRRSAPVVILEDVPGY